ncbi:MAG: MOSC domain-containing protein [Rhizobiaceae bacterium]
MGEELGCVSQVWRYPASSLAGERPVAIEVGFRGVSGDRGFGVVEAATGEPGRPDGDRKWHGLPWIRTRLSDTGLQVAVPGGDWLDAPGEECDGVLSGFLDFAVSLRPFSREAAPEFGGPLSSSRYDVAPVHLLTTASLAELRRLSPDTDPDPRRFRPNVLVEMPAVAGRFPETEWIGRRIAVGEVELTISEPCRRCGFTIIAQDGFDNDPEVLRQLVRHNGRNIGIYCRVDRPGRISDGDSLRFL